MRGGSSSRKEQEDPPSLLLTLVGVGLFLLSTAVSQWVQNQHRVVAERDRQRRRLFRKQQQRLDDVDDDDDDDAEQHEEDRDEERRRHHGETLRRLYQQRRLRDRLSYEDLSKWQQQLQQQQGPYDQREPQGNLARGTATGPGGVAGASGTGNHQHQRGFPSSPHDATPSWSVSFPDPNVDDDDPDTNNNASSSSLSSAIRWRQVPQSEWNLHRMHRRSSLQNGGGGPSQHTPALSAGKNDRWKEAQEHPNADYDFHPKNRNWRHFEHYNEKDRKRYEEAKAAKVAAAEADRKMPLEADHSAAGGIDPNQARERDLRNTEAENAEGPSGGERPHQLRTSPPVTRDSTLDGDNRNNNEGNLHCQQRSDIGTSDDVSEDFGEDDARSISSSSMSSEEQFVWTKHQHRGASNAVSPPARGDTTSSISDGLKAVSVSNELSLSSRADGLSKAPPRSASFSGQTTSGSSGAFTHLKRPYSYVKRMLSLGSSEEEAKATTATSVGEPHCGPPRIDRNAPVRPPPPPLSYSTEVHNRVLRAEYNARIMPQKLVLIRHGQSMGNVNEVLYSTTPDNSIHLTDLGWEEARRAGTILKEKILTPNESVHFVVSPYVRTVETFHGLVSAWCDPNGEEFTSISNHDEKVKAWYRRLMELGLTWNEDSRLREQDFGNYQKPEVIKRAKEERHRFGAFYYRFPHGESASDVFDRVSTFLDSLWRSFEMNKSRNYVLVTHGIVLRVLLARYFRYTIDQFNMLANPRNCEMVVLGPSPDGKLDLEGRCALDVEEEPETHQSHVTGYKFHKRLRILPKSAIRKVKIRISPNDS
jgi:broad specificity phosphatase PhoE